MMFDQPDQFELESPTIEQSLSEKVKGECKHCGKPFVVVKPSRFKKIFCSQLCGNRYRRPPGRVMKKECKHCEKEFIAKGIGVTTKLYCSSLCHSRQSEARRHPHRLMEFGAKCKRCEKPFTVKGAARQKYCSRKCCSVFHEEERRKALGIKRQPPIGTKKI